MDTKGQNKREKGGEKDLKREGKKEQESFLRTESDQSLS